MKLQASSAKNICLFIIVTAVFCSCSARRERVYSMDAAATLKDRIHMAVTLDIEFEKKSGVAEAVKKKQQIKYAVSLIFREYTSDQVTSMKKTSMNSTIKAILVRILDSAIKSVKTSGLSVDDKNTGGGH